MKICFVVPYFGKFHKYFQLVLNSMKTNPDVNWLIFTDDTTDYLYPTNVCVKYMSFGDLQDIIRSKFDFDISIERPYKLCDYKPAYGYIFEEYLTDYDWWGFCDVDLIFGRIRHFITDEMLKTYDKIFSVGHMTLFRNDYENNRKFMMKLKGLERYKQVFQDENNLLFDEGNNESINTLWDEYNFSCQKQHFYSSMVQKSCFFRKSVINETNYTYYSEKKCHQIFWWDNGRVLLSYIEKGKYYEEEYIYIHLLRRTNKFKVNLNQQTCSLYKIIPHEFDELKEPICELNYKKEKWWNFNLFYFEIRWNNLKTKIKTRF